MKTRNKLSAGVSLRTKKELLFLATSVAVIITIICLILYFNLGHQEDAAAAGSSYSSTVTGNWSTGSTWAGGNAPPVNVNGDAITVNTNHTVTRFGNLSAQNNSSFVIHSNSTLRIEGDFTVQNNLILTVHGTLIVTGKIDAKNGSNVTIGGGGNVTVGGDFEVNNNANISVNGTLNIGGDLSFGSNPVFSGNGTVNIAGTGCNQWNGSGTCNEHITLPVELVSFEAINDDGHVWLKWKTATELNNDIFIIERSANGIDYEFIASIKGNGTTKIASDYTHEDTDPLNGISYYRLSQTDYDGSVTTFRPVSVKVDKEHVSSFSVYPNPLTGSALTVNFDEPQKGLIQIIDANGNQVLSKAVDNTTENTRLALQDDLSPGFYYVKFITSASTESVKIVKQ